MTGQIMDIAIIGGGVNGCGIARDAVGRGASVVLFEQNDLASGTSSASTKLIHGGLRYLEHYEFRLVREALMEREVVWRLAPHIVWPLRFVLPHHDGLRPWWLLRLGLFLYDNLGGRKLLPGTTSLDLTTDAAGKPLKPLFTRAFEYSDCWVEDSRLVVLNARDAADRGATIHTRTRVVGAVRENGHWLLTAEHADGRRETVRAKVLVNAAGPWVGDVLGGVVKANAPASVRLVQGSHIVVPRMFDHDRCYIFQNSDNRIIFAIPYERDFTLIGTTDQDYVGDPAGVVASEAEISYLCAAASEYFRRPVLREDVVWTYSGVRSLYDDGASKAQEATRDYVLTLDAPDGAAPLLSVFGGKITDVPAAGGIRDGEAGRHPAGGIATELDGRPRAAGRRLPADRLRGAGGGDPGRAALARPGAGRAAGARLWNTGRDDPVRGQSMADLGRVFGADLTEREVLYLMRQEWAVQADDVLWRRTKLGLRLTVEQRAALGDFMAAQAMAPAAQA